MSLLICIFRHIYTSTMVVYVFDWFLLCGEASNQIWSVCIWIHVAYRNADKWCLLSEFIIFLFNLKTRYSHLKSWWNITQNDGFFSEQKKKLYPWLEWYFNHCFWKYLLDFYNWSINITTVVLTKCCIILWCWFGRSYQDNKVFMPGYKTCIV